MVSVVLEGVLGVVPVVSEGVLGVEPVVSEGVLGVVSVESEGLWGMAPAKAIAPAARTVRTVEKRMIMMLEKAT